MKDWKELRSLPSAIANFCHCLYGNLKKKINLGDLICSLFLGQSLQITKFLAFEAYYQYPILEYVYQNYKFFSFDA